MNNGNQGDENKENEYTAEGEGITAKTRIRNLDKVEVYVHELTDIRREIIRGIPINRGLYLFWSLFCLCAGSIIQAAIQADIHSKTFNLTAFLESLSPLVQSTLVFTFLASLLLFFFSKAQSSALDGIDQILDQCGYEPKKKK